MKNEKVQIAAAYARISGGGNPQDLNNQIVPIAEFAKNRGFELTHQFTDEISGATARRPGLDAMLMAARKGQFKVLIVIEISRLARDVRHLLNILHELDSLKVSVTSIREGIQFDSVMGRAMVAMIGILMSVERQLLKERIRSALYTKRLHAEKMGIPFKIGRPPIPESLIVEARTLRDQGLSFRAIEKKLGKRLSKSSIARLKAGG